ncbi:MAG: THUMP domain-containing protein, partial [Deltaproteobacteria bacterium]
MSVYQLFATAAKGTEGVLRDELRELSFRDVRADRGGVHFAGSIDEAARACLHSRIAMRILVQLGRFPAPSAQALYDGARTVDFTPYLSAHHTIAVSGTCRSSVLTHSHFIALKTKDAIVDQLRDLSGARPSVDIRDPDVRIAVHLVRDVATLYLDASGEPLHRRGYRRDLSEAPIKETLAAAILRLAGWDRARPLIDPMCGSGTFVIEADHWARNVAPGLARNFGFERWATHDRAARTRFESLREAARAEQLDRGPETLGTDVDEMALGAARANARTGQSHARFEQRSIRDLQPTDPPGFVVTNPPYGERLEADDELYRELAQALSRMRG